MIRLLYKSQHYGNDLVEIDDEFFDGIVCRHFSKCTNNTLFVEDEIEQLQLDLAPAKQNIATLMKVLQAQEKDKSNFKAQNQVPGLASSAVREQHHAYNNKTHLVSLCHHTQHGRGTHGN